MLNRIPAQIMALERPFSRGWLKAKTPSTPRMTPRRRRLDPDAAVDEADQRAGDGLFQPDLTFRGSFFGPGLLQRGRERLHLAKLGRAFMADPVDGAQQQADPDFLRERGESVGIEP